MLRSGQWLDPLVDATLEGRRTLVVCRTIASLRAVQRRLAHERARTGRCAFEGLELTTLRGLIAGSQPRSLQPDLRRSGAGDDLPEHHPWKSLLAERPRLRRTLRGHLERAHGARLIGLPLERLRPELRSLVDAGWGLPDELEGARRLLRKCRPAERRFAIGFASDFSFAGALQPLDHGLLRALAAEQVTSVDPQQVTARPLPALRVPDVAAEARAIAFEARALEREHVVVLVPDTPSEERIQAALRRNGLAVADDGSSLLGRQSACAVVAPLLPLFASRASLPLEATDLMRLLIDPVVGAAALGAALGPLAAAESASRPRASVRHLRDLIVACHRTRARLEEWVGRVRRIEEVARIEHEESSGEHRFHAARRLAAARTAAARLSALTVHAAGGGRLADVAGFLRDIGLGAHEDDRVGRALVRALEASGEKPAEAEAFAEAVSGGLGSSRVEEGIEVLPYLAYDGRDCDLLVLTGVHDQGLARPPAADPFLEQEDHAVLGLPTPREAVLERLAIARWACSRARSVLALVCETDASGRPVTAPPELAFDWVDGAPRLGSYGLALDLPERNDWEAFVPGSNTGVRDELAVQIDVEWARAGALLGVLPKDAVANRTALPDAATLQARDERTPEAPRTLVDHLALREHRFPEDLRPWLGEVRAARPEESELPEKFVLSATRLRAFTQCLYRAFCETLLRLEPLEQIEEELRGRELGSAIHAVIHESLAGAHLLVPGEQLEAARGDALARLEKATEARLAEAAEEMSLGVPSEPLAVARQGLADRWRRHWQGWLADRIRSVDEANRALLRRLTTELRSEGAFAPLLGRIAPHLKKSPRRDLESALASALEHSGGRLGALIDRSHELAEVLAPSHRDAVRAALATPEARVALEQLCDRLARRAEDEGFSPRGDLQVVRSEYSFGSSVPSLAAETTLPLGRDPVAIRGSIDAVLSRRGKKEGAPLRYRIVDFKTGVTRPREDELMETLTEPQLALYALALQAEGSGSVEHVELDFVALNERIQAATPSKRLEEAARTFGALLDRARGGRFTLAPHPHSCPKLGGHGWCDAADICRLRPSWADAPVNGGDE